MSGYLKLPLAVASVGEKYVRSTRFEIINAGTSGSVTLPPDSEVVLDDFGGTVDAVVSGVSSSYPTLSPAKTAAGAVVATTFDSNGAWTFTGTPASYPVAILYRVRQELQNFDSDATNIWGNTITEQSGLPTGGATDTILTKNSSNDYDTEWTTPGSIVSPFLPYYSTGEDGDVTVTGDTPLGRATFYNNLTINNGGVLRPQGFAVYVKGTLTINAGGFIRANGGDASNGSAGGGGGAGGPVATANEIGGTAGATGGGTGGAGGTAGGSQAASISGQVCLGGLAAGNGGQGGTGSGGSGGASRSGSTGTWRPASYLTTYFFSGTSLKGGGQSAPGGSGGGGDGTSGAGGGGGGGGGGNLMIYCDTLVNNGEIQAKGGNGGNGGNATAGNRGGGGGGGGGCGGYILLVARVITTLGTVAVNGGVAGSGGNGFGTGTAGTAGTDGATGRYRVFELSTKTWAIL